MEASTNLTPKPTRRNPRLDDSRDDAILSAAASLLAEVGYDAMSIEAIATRAGVGKATIYRRWSDKAAVVLDTLRSRGLPLSEAPDTGSLRGDLLALFLNAQDALSEEQGVAHLLGVLVAMRSHPELATLVEEQLVSLWARATDEIVKRAIARGEIAARSDESIELFSNVGPSMVALRLLMDAEPIDATFIAQLVDEILLPILRSP